MNEQLIVSSTTLSWLPFLIPFIFLDLVLKALALWRSARNGSKVWFVSLLIFNTLGILPAVYILGFSKKK